MKMNKIRLHEQVETMNKKQLICLCKSLIDINCELENKINKAIEYNQKIYDTSTENERLMAKINLDILRGEDNEPKKSN